MILLPSGVSIFFQKERWKNPNEFILVFIVIQIFDKI